MTNETDTAIFDALIHRARVKLRHAVATEPDRFDGKDNPRLDPTIGDHAAFGTLAVPGNIDTKTTAGLMASVDLTLLDEYASHEQIEAISARAKKESVAAVCVYPQHVALVQSITGGSPPPIAVVGFPSVADPVQSLEATVQQTHRAIRSGAKEIDMVLPTNFKDGNPDYAAHYRYLRAVVQEAARHNVPVKVILETAYLTDTQKVEGAMLAKMAGATFVKTSTGLAQPELMRPEIPSTQTGATAHDVALLRRTVGDTTISETGKIIPMGVKASGGIRTREQVVSLYNAGADRIGASGGVDVRTMVEKQVIDRRNATVLSERTSGY